MSYLESREEQERLIAAGLTREQVEAVAKIPQIPFDPLTLLKQTQRSR